MRDWEYTKGHGTENDFVLLPDAQGRLEITPQIVRAICHRRTGIGADGLIRVVREADGFFMDYYNADGSLAEMCGNGARVFGRYLVDAGWAPPGEIIFRTRAGQRRAEVPECGDVTIWMGQVSLGDEETATVGGHGYPGRCADVGNPHLVCLVTAAELPEIDLSQAPGFDPIAFPDGVNVEFVAPGGDDDHILMRVYERGSGETRSCGTGTVAAAAVALAARGRTQGTVQVTVPGGQIQVAMCDQEVTLTGPAVLIADGRLRNIELA